MFARFLELTIKPDTKTDLINVMKDQVLPVLKKCHGFFDLIPLEVEAEPTKFYVLSLWHDKRDAEIFHNDTFPTVRPMYEQFLAAPIAVKLCHVDESVTAKKFTALAA